MCDKYERLLKRNLEIAGIVTIVLMMLIALIYFHSTGDIIVAVAVGFGGGYVIATLISITIGLCCVIYDKLR